MTNKEYNELLPFLKTLTPEQAKIVWYMEARKKGNPCITEEQKQTALNTPLTDIKKLRLHDFSHGYESNYY